MRSLQSLVTLFYEKTAGWRGEVIRRWGECVGDLAAHMSCARIEGTILFVYVHNARWMHELYMLSPEITEAIRRAVPEAQITDIRYSYKPRMAKGVHEAYKKEIQKPTPVVTLSPRERASLEQIADKELRDVLLAYKARLIP